MFAVLEPTAEENVYALTKVYVLQADAWEHAIKANGAVVVLTLDVQPID